MTTSASDPGRDDVLASIRRLVAAAPDHPAATPEPAPAPAASSDRLLLTPALRVADPAETSAPAARPMARGLTLEDRIAELEAAVGSQASEFEPDGSEVAHLRPPEELVRAVENLDFGAEDAPESGDAAERAMPEADDATAAGADAGDRAGPAETTPGDEDPAPRRGLFLAASTPETTVAPEPPATSAQDTLSDLPAGLFFTRHERATTEARPFPTIGAATEPPEAEAEAEAEAADALPKIEAAAAPITLDTAPEFRHRDAGGGAEEGEVAAEDAEEAAPEEPGTAPADPLAHAPGGTDEAPLDEEMLRRVVAELLREELQGPLGEKITRNIRKLVRREIERALTVRDFD